MSASRPAVDRAHLRGTVLSGVSLLRAHFTTHSFERHSHETFSIGVTHGGVQCFRCRGTEHTSVAGHVILFNPDEPHDGHAGAREGFAYSMLYIERAAMRALQGAELAGARGEAFFRPTVVADAASAAALASAIELLEGSHESLAACAGLARAARALFRRYGDGGPAVTSRTRRDEAGTALDRAREYLESFYATDVRVEDLTRLTQCSRAHTTRSFAARFGAPPHLYLNAVRIRHAKRLLADGMTPADVAAAVGYADQSHLARRFKGSVGLTPGAWARAMRAPR